MIWIIFFVLLASTPLLWNETQAWSKLKPLLIDEVKVQLEAFGINGYLGNDLKIAMDAVVAKRSSTEAEVLASKYKSEIEVAFKKAGIKMTIGYGGGTQYSPLEFNIRNKDLSATRALLRKHFGTWSDKVDAVSVGKEWDMDYSKQEQMVRATFKSPGKDPYCTIKTKYLMNEIPKGLLKPGCEIKEVEHEVEYEVSCAI